MGIAAGIMIILISIAHNVYGEKKQLPELEKLTSDPVMIGSMRIMIYQGGILLLATGAVQVLSSTGMVELSGMGVYFPLGIILVNFLTTLTIAALFHREIFKVTVPQFVIFSIIIILQIISL